MNFGVGTFSLLLVAMTMSQVTAFTVGGTFLSAAEKAALEETAAAVATAGKGITGRSRLCSSMGRLLPNNSNLLQDTEEYMCYGPHPSLSPHIFLTFSFYSVR